MKIVVGDGVSLITRVWSWKQLENVVHHVDADDFEGWEYLVTVDASCKKAVDFGATIKREER